MKMNDTIKKRAKLFSLITSYLVIIFVGWQLNSYSQKIRNVKPTNNDDSSLTLQNSDIIGISYSSSSWGERDELTLNFTDNTIQKEIKGVRNKDKDKEGTFKGKITRVQKEKLIKIIEKEHILRLASNYSPKDPPSDSVDWSIGIKFSNGWQKGISGYHVKPDELRKLLEEIDNTVNDVQFSKTDYYKPIEEQPVILNW